MNDGGPTQLEWPAPTSFPKLDADGIHVWGVPLDRARLSSDQAAEVLSHGETERAASFATDKPRQAFMVTRFALRTLLGRYLGVLPQEVSIVVEPGGKPRLAASELQFNVAHSGNLALIAITYGYEIGIDIELLRPIDRSLEIAARNFHPHELAAIHAASGNDLTQNFLRCWTRKEAVLKAMGMGLGYPLDAFDVLTQLTDMSAIELPSHDNHPARRCWLHDLRPSSDYCAAIAITAPINVSGMFRFSI